jgi:phosphoribosylformimino-5-aminoimidazole carboxamide ribotide isomerase
LLIPSIDLMGGRIVQLVQGKRKELEFDNFEPWAERFSSFPLVQLIDLDAAMGRAPNSELIEFFVNKLPCQVGGGIGSIESAKNMIALGAQRIILGSRLIQEEAINSTFAEAIATEVGQEKLVFAIDSRAGKVAIRGWKQITSLSPVQMVKALDDYCCAFLYTHIDTEGLMSGMPLPPIRELRQATAKQLIVAGGISTHAEVEQLHAMGVDAVVGMALYTGRLTLPDNIPLSK